MSKFLDETGLTYLTQKLDERFNNKFGEMYVSRNEFDSSLTDINSDIEKAMYGPYSVGYESVQFTSGTGVGTVENKSLLLTGAFGDNSPRIYVIDLSLSQRAPSSIVRNLNLNVGATIASDISVLSPATAGYQGRFNNLSGGIQRVVIRFTGSNKFLSDSVYITLTNGGFYKSYTLSATEPAGIQSQLTYQILKLKGINNNLSYVIIDFVGHGKFRLSTLNTTVFAVPQIVGCIGWLDN